ncbi:methylglyoxal synthase MgsA [Thermoclostridium stercorarium subsp. stercorarium DSM 8532]|jgi:methylglyoxal synthase|uniref:Methylglyoxal synthase n=5 Tax=Thermoclostridium stercorarium TaxID=1510 RepID=L7VGL1_THES1|nr:methylglyoxal synthase MgsA [Thermoclostridium stercorarium subsp. stercorarium DSM 8532]ANW97596.1 methylglyoxal synthase [Thermoclostridium stercorarium subsp. thermolacticum DSM 2910]
MLFLKITEAGGIMKIGKQKTIALIAHDNRKKDLVEWVKRRKEVLSRHFLCGTGTTAALITKETDLPVRAYKSGPLGGDQQIGALIAEGKVDFMIFFWDPLTAQPHDPDVKALLRIAVLYDIPVAMNQCTADFLITSPLMEEEYENNVLTYKSRIEKW